MSRTTDQTEERERKILDLTDRAGLQTARLQGFISLLVMTDHKRTADVTPEGWTGVTYLGECLFNDLKKSLKELDDLRRQQATD